jgi:hypothetical protein
MPFFARKHACFKKVDTQPKNPKHPQNLQIDWSFSAGIDPKISFNTAFILGIAYLTKA